MKRDLTQLAGDTYDVIIIGGGIYGAWAAWDAALRGLSVALVEKGDFGGATSSNSLKIIHGGLRYLQHADLKRMRESIGERATLMRIAPHLVHPLPCVMPTYGHGLKGREVMAVALLLNDLVGFDRNRLRDPQKKLPNGRIISRAETLQLLPGLPQDGLTGGAIWYDCQIYNSERLLLALLHGAEARGARVANYAPVVDFLRQENRIIGVKVRDAIGERHVEIRGRLVLNTSGPWINKTLGLLNGARPKAAWQFSKALNLVVRRQLIPEYGAGIPSKYEFRDADAVLNKGARLLFFTPWRQYTLIGTTHVPYSGSSDDFRITEQDVADLLQEFNQAYPAMQVTREDISYFYGGLLPADAADAEQGTVTLTKHYKLIDHEKQGGLAGLISILGVKYTTARDVAAKAIDLAAKKLHHRETATHTDHQPVPGGDIPYFDEYLQQEIAKRPWDLPPEQIRHLVYNYGTAYPEVLRYLEEHGNWREKVAADEEVIAAEVVHAVRDEMALKLADVVRRRTELGASGCPAAADLQKTARLMAGELGWDAGHIAAEIAATQQLYQPA